MSQNFDSRKILLDRIGTDAANILTTNNYSFNVSDIVRGFIQGVDAANNTLYYGLGPGKRIGISEDNKAVAIRSMEGFIGVHFQVDTDTAHSGLLTNKGEEIIEDLKKFIITPRTALVSGDVALDKRLQWNLITQTAHIIGYGLMVDYPVYDWKTNRGQIDVTFEVLYKELY